MKKTQAKKSHATVPLIKYTHDYPQPPVLLDLELVQYEIVPVDFLLRKPY
jgi:hypothetical protein